MFTKKFLFYFLFVYERFFNSSFIIFWIRETRFLALYASSLFMYLSKSFKCFSMCLRSTSVNAMVRFSLCRMVKGGSRIEPKYNKGFLQSSDL